MILTKDNKELDNNSMPIDPEDGATTSIKSKEEGDTELDELKIIRHMISEYNQNSGNYYVLLKIQRRRFALW